MKKTIIIAEAGVNHNGSIDKAYQLIDIAADAGVDYVKFQTYRTENLVSKNCRKADYQMKNIGDDDMSQYKMLKNLELSIEDHYLLKDYCVKRGVKFLSSAFDLDSVEFLGSMLLDLWKIPSGEITNYPYLHKIAQYNQMTILSTGMSTLEDIRLAVKVLLDGGLDKDKLIILHCNTEYPTPMKDVNLKAMYAIKSEFGVRVGYSDHTEGIEVPIAAVALGAEVIEKHFTIDKTMVGPDHKASLSPDELKQMVKAIRNIENALGSAEKYVSESELKNVSIARKSIVAAVNIKKGDLLTDKNITVKRPGGGLSPMLWNEVVGTIAKQDYLLDELIEL